MLHPVFSCVSLLHVHVCACFVPVVVYMRHRALNHSRPDSGWSNYTCCQGYYGGCCCFQPGQCCESTCPCPCMCCEAMCCPGLAVSATSMVVREKHGLGLDADDVRLIRCSNCLQILSCLCTIIACLTPNERDDQFAYIFDLFADCVFCSVASCSTAQTYHEIIIQERRAAANSRGAAPSRQRMNR